MAGWEKLESHGDLGERLAGLTPSHLRCIRMMGTFVGAAGSAAKKEIQEARSEEVAHGLIDQTVRHLDRDWATVQSMLLIGSRNEAIPADQAPYQFYTYLFVARVASELIGRLEDPRRVHKPGAYDQLVIRFTFVPEDILFAQFFYDEEYLFVAASYSWDTFEEIEKDGYIAVYLDNRRNGVDRESSTAPTTRQCPNLSRRLVGIFDARFREQAALVGQEIWTVKRVNARDWGVLVETAFWGESTKGRAFDFRSSDTPQMVELGRNSLRLFIDQVRARIGPSPLAESKSVR